MPNETTLPINYKNLTLIDLPNGLKFPVQTFFRQQRLKTEDLALSIPHVTELISYWSKNEGGNANPERTLKSEICCEWEALSRNAKVRWAIKNGHDVRSLQHDGVVLALRKDISVQQACKELQAVSSHATSYSIPVANKPMDIQFSVSPIETLGAMGRPIGHKLDTPLRFQRPKRSRTIFPEKGCVNGGGRV